MFKARVGIRFVIHARAYPKEGGNGHVREPTRVGGRAAALRRPPERPAAVAPAGRARPAQYFGAAESRRAADGEAGADCGGPVDPRQRAVHRAAVAQSSAGARARLRRLRGARAGSRPPGDARGGLRFERQPRRMVLSIAGGFGQHRRPAPRGRTPGRHAGARHLGGSRRRRAAHRIQRCDARPSRSRRARGGHRLHGSHRRRERRRQGAGRAPDSRSRPPAARTLRGHQLRGPGRDAASRRNSSASRSGRRPAFGDAAASSSTRTAARSFSTRSRTCRWRRRPSCCGPSRT